MPRNSSGQYSPPEGVIVTSGQTILPQQHNPFITDAGQAISDSLSRDGRGGMRNDLDMGGFSVRNMAAGVNPNDAATVAQIQSAAGVPVGAMFQWPAAVAPTGYLTCMGQSLSRAQYPLLFTVLGTTYGSVNGQSFNLPDLRGRVVAGLDTQQSGAFADRLTSPDSRTIGAAGGLQSIVLTLTQLAKHAHNVVVSLAGKHSHRARVGDGFEGATYLDMGNQNPLGWQAGKIEEDGEHAHPVVEQERGNNEAHPNVQPTIILNFIIKAF